MQIASKAKAIRLAARLAGFESEQHRHGEAPSLMMSTRSLETMDIIYFRTDDTVASKQAMQFLPEGRTYSIDNKWSVRADKAHVQGMKNHNHIQLKGSEVAVINTDGTPSHGSDLSQVPAWIFTWIKDKRLNESYLSTETITERVPAAVVAEALRHEMTVQQSVEHLNKTSGKH